MYHLIISGARDAWNGEPYVVPAGRYLEHTDDAIRARYSDISAATVAELKRIPALFAYEAHIDAPARVGWITSIKTRDNEVRLTYRFDESFDAIPSDSLINLGWDLEIGKFEFNRTHWAIKATDLFSVVTAAGFCREDARTDGTNPHFAFSRRTLIAACDMLQALGHTGLDRFLLELGVEGIDAGREKGGLLARANALAEFVLENQTAPTAERESLSYAVVNRAAASDPGYPDSYMPGVSEEARHQFWRSLEQDGYTFVDGSLVSLEWLEPELPREELPSSAPTVLPGDHAIREDPPMANNKVFLVHGRDHGSMHEVARYLERLGLDVVILHERPNGGRTLISKFQEESSDVAFAVVLMTADDLGKLKGDQNPVARARQNVVFELGFFIGRLGAQNVCALVESGVERPSDFESIVYIEFGSTSAWKTEIARELRAAGIPFDHSKVF